MAIIDQVPIFLVFIYLRKEYGTLDQGHLLEILEGYCIGPHMCGILADFWECQEVVTQKIGTLYLTYRRQGV